MERRKRRSVAQPLTLRDATLFLCRPFLRKLTSKEHGNTLENASPDSALCECSAQHASFENTSPVGIIESVCLAADCGPHPAAAQPSPPHVREVEATPRRRKRAAAECSAGSTLKSPRLSQVSPPPPSTFFADRIAAAASPFTYDISVLSVLPFRP